MISVEWQNLYFSSFYISQALSIKKSIIKYVYGSETLIYSKRIVRVYTSESLKRVLAELILIPIRLGIWEITIK